METFERDVRVDAPLADVWEFHSTIDGLLALTPAWANLRVDGIDWPEGDGEENDLLVEGTRIHMSVQPFGVGPRQTWTSHITERVEELADGRAYFVDEMVDGPFPAWRHTHSFSADGDQTVARDRVEYRAPLGPLGALGAPAVLWPMFRFRHRRTRERLGDA
jgi:ligand-binding SRPBCC domain-containing protein